MRYAVISDIHSNIQALKAVFRDIAGQRIDRVISLGDVVGYGPNPAEVIDLLSDVGSDVVLGNHDAAVAGYFPIDKFNSEAKSAIEWTTSTLTERELEFLRKQPLEIIFENSRFAHAGFENSASFSYIINEEDAISSFNVCNEQLLFTGHSHIPGIFVIGNSGVPHWLPPLDFQAENEKRYIINVGSVGYPRDNDFRASYCIFDTSNRDIYFRKVPFDLEALKKSLLNNGLYADFPFFTLANLVDFQIQEENNEFKKPEKNQAFKPLSNEESEKLLDKVNFLNTKFESLYKSHRRLLFFLMLIFSGILACGAYFIFDSNAGNNLGEIKKIIFNQSKHLELLSIYNEIPADNRTLPYNKNLLPVITEKGEVEKNNRLQYWNVILLPESQKINIVESQDSKHNKYPTFEILSHSMQSIVLYSAFAFAKKGMRFKASAQFKALHFDDGSVQLALEYCLPDGSWKTLLQKNPTKIQTSKRWLCVSVTMPKISPLLKDYPMRLSLRLSFKGKILIRKTTLLRKK